MPDIVNFILHRVMFIVLKICEACPEQCLGLIIPHFWDNALLCVLLNTYKSWGLPVWPVGTGIIPSTMSVPGTVVNNPFESLFTDSQVVSLYSWADQSNKLKQLQNLFVSCLSGMIILWTDVQYLANFCFIFPFFCFFRGEGKSH